MGRGRMLAGVVVALLLAACGNGEATPLTDPSTAPTTSATTATTAPPSTSSTTGATTAATTTTTTVPVETVGSPAEFEAQIDAVYDFLGEELVARNQVPFPDATNVDPVVAFEDLITFHYWMLSTNPWPEWVQLYALDGTEYALDRRIQADRYTAPPSLMQFDPNEPFALKSAEVVDLLSIGAPPAVLDELPGSAVGVEYTSSVGDFFVASTDDGTVFERYDGWVDLVSQAIVVPTDAGWRIAYVRWNN